MRKTGRNDPCPCNSGKKYKQCCQRRDEALATNQRHETVPASHSLQAALEHHQAGRLPQAEAIYRQILQQEPSHPDALHMSGVIASHEGKHEIAVELINKAISTKPSSRMHYNLGLVFQAQGKLDKAVESYRRALMIEPSNAEAHINLGNVLCKQGKLDEAVKHYRKGLLFNPNNAEAHVKLGVALKALGRLDEAITCYQQALRIKPDYAEAYGNLGVALKALGRLDEAITCYQQVLRIKPDYTEAHSNLGNALKVQGRLDEAITSYQQALRLDPKNESIQHLISAITGKTTERPSSQYIEDLFDDYANRFDTHLVQHLEYKIPSELVALLKQAVEFPSGGWDVLDLGCGTGLAGLEISPHARQLVGVDLSSKMLAKAQARNIYHRLEHSDLLPMMRDEEASSYDVIIAADVLVYLGRLDEIVSEAKRLLRTGGFFMFSVEALEAQVSDSVNLEGEHGYKLNQSGRYAHSATYLKNLACINNFYSISLTSTPVRIENGLPVAAWVAVWKG